MTESRKVHVTWIETVKQDATFEVGPGFDPFMGVYALLNNISVTNVEGDFPKVEILHQTLAGWRWVE